MEGSHHCFKVLSQSDSGSVAGLALDLQTCHCDSAVQVVPRFKECKERRISSAADVASFNTSVSPWHQSHRKSRPRLTASQDPGSSCDAAILPPCRVCLASVVACVV